MKRKLLTLAALTIPIWLISAAQALACPVSGTVHGARGSVVVILIDPSSGNFLMEANATPHYSFARIPSGSYILRVYRRGVGKIGTNPSEAWVECGGGFPITGVDFYIT